VFGRSRDGIDVKHQSRATPRRGLPLVNQGAQRNRLGTDRVAFEAFYRAHFDEVLGFVTRRVADPYTAADLTADVFVRALEAAASYPGGGQRGCLADRDRPACGRGGAQESRA